MKNLLYIVSTLLMCGISSSSATNAVIDHRVVFFAGDYCKSHCYETRTYKKSCMWFRTTNLDISISDLSDHSDYYTEEYDKVYARGELITSKTRRVRFTWDREINRVYIGNNYTKVMIWEEENFGGRGLEFWGQGCHDLEEYGWKNRAKSMKIVHRY